MRAETACFPFTARFARRQGTRIREKMRYMSSFAVGDLILKEHQQWVIDNMEENSYLLDLNDTWLCYLTRRDNDIMWNREPSGKRRIPRSVAAISEKAPVFYLQHPEDYGWMYFAIDKGAVVGSLEINYEEERIKEHNGFDSLALFGFDEAVIHELKEKIDLNTEDMEDLFSLPDILNSALSTDIDFISYEYVLDEEEVYPNIIAKK